MERRFGKIGHKYGKVINFIHHLHITPLRWNKEQETIQVSTQSGHLQAFRIACLTMHAISMGVNSVKVLKTDLGNNLFGSLQVVRYTAEFWLININSVRMMRNAKLQTSMVNELLETGASFYGYQRGSDLKILKDSNGTGKSYKLSWRVMPFVMTFLTAQRVLRVLRIPQSSAIYSSVSTSSVPKPGILLRIGLGAWECFLMSTRYGMIFQNVSTTFRMNLGIFDGNGNSMSSIIYDQ